MSAVPKTVKPLPLPAGSPPERSARRPGARPGAQTSDVRRRLQRDLDRREASLRVNRRVSGPVGGITRTAGPAPAVNPVQRVAAPATPAAPAAPPAVKPSTQVPRAPQRAARGPIRPAAAAARMQAPKPAPQPAPRAIPVRPPLVTIEGGQAAQPRSRRRLSVGTVFVSAVVLVVITIGLIVALQIQKTQVNEQIGADLAQVSRQEQAVTQLREQISRQVAGAQIAGEISRRGLVEPDVADVRYLKAGVRASTAERAAEALANAPVAGSAAAAAAADAATAATAADVVAPGSDATTKQTVASNGAAPPAEQAAGTTAVTGAVTAP